MKKLAILFVALLLHSAPAYSMYVEGNFGGGTGVRLGTQDSWDRSFGYVKTGDLRTLSLETYKVLPAGVALFKVGGGLGFSIPDLSDRKGDNDISFVLGGQVEYPLANGWSIAGSIKGIFFHTKTRQTIYGSHVETLSNGAQVEVLDTYHVYDSERIDEAVLGVNLRYSF